MQQFLKVFVDILLWRRGPQDLPASGLLVVVTLAAYELLSLLSIVLLPASPAERVLFLVVDPILLLGGLWLVLRLYGRTERWPQAAAAMLGCMTLLSMAALAPLLLLLGGRDLSNPPAGVFPIQLAYIVAVILVVGRILQQATESNLFTGVAIATTYVVIMETLAGIVHGTAS